MALGAGAEEISVLVPAFEGGPTGRSVATIYNLKVWRDLRVAHDPRGKIIGGKIRWSDQTLPQNSHEVAESAAINTDSQFALWGSATELGNEVLVRCFLSIPDHEDLNQRYFEKWFVSLPCEGHNIELEVTLPRRRYEFSPTTVSRSLVEQYSVPSAVKVYKTKKRGTPIGTLGNTYEAHTREGNYTEVSIANGSKGWVYLPGLDNEIEVVNFVGGLVRLFRGDYLRAAELFQKVSQSGAGTLVQFDALLLQGLATSKDGGNAGGAIDAAIALNPHLHEGIKFKIVQLVSAFVSSDSGTEQQSVTRELSELISNNAYLFSPDDKWFSVAREAFACMSKESTESTR